MNDDISHRRASTQLNNTALCVKKHYCTVERMNYITAAMFARSTLGFVSSRRPNTCMDATSARSLTEMISAHLTLTDLPCRNRLPASCLTFNKQILQSNSPPQVVWFRLCLVIWSTHRNQVKNSKNVISPDLSALTNRK